jgi:hypothetical protein
VVPSESCRPDRRLLARLGRLPQPSQSPSEVSLLWHHLRLVRNTIGISPSVVPSGCRQDRRLALSVAFLGTVTVAVGNLLLWHHLRLRRNAIGISFGRYRPVPSRIAVC